MTDEAGATAELEEVTQEQPQSMEDTIRETLRSLQDKGQTVETESPESPEAPEEKAQRIRDEKGKFKPKSEPAAVAPDVTPMETVTKPAPNTWKKEAQEKWTALPPDVQAEVERREADFHKGIEQYRNKAQFADTLERVIAPHAATLQALNVTPDFAVKELLQADHLLRYGSPQEKQIYLAQLAHSYGIDIGQVQNYQPPAYDPMVSSLQQEVQQLRGLMQQQTTMEQQRQLQTLNSEVEAFKADPSHSHFEAVREDMAGLLQAELATSLKDAYEQAIWRNPTTRAALIAEQQKAAREEAAQKAQAAKAAASVNVKARPSMPVSQPIGSMDETIRATLRRLQNA